MHVVSYVPNSLWDKQAIQAHASWILCGKNFKEINVVYCVGRVEIQIVKSKYKKVGVLAIRIVWSNVSSIGPSSERNRK